MKAWKVLIVFLLVLMLPMAVFATTANAEETLETSKLEEYLRIASNAEQSNYTTESWQLLEKAVAKANEALASGSQLKVNSAVAHMSTALSKLTSMDYSKLDPIIQEAEKYIQEAFGDWLSLFELLMDYHNLYGCGDQDAVDEAVKEIRNCLDILQEKEAPQQADPEPASSGKNRQAIWIILLVISVLCNIALAIMVIFHIELPINRKNREQVDDMPLVDYDIDDDFV